MQTPNEPPYQPPQESPIPSPYVATTGGPVPPSGPAQINFDVIGRAWEVLKPNIGIWIGAFLVYLIIVSVISTIIVLLGGSGARLFPTPGEVPAGMPAQNVPVMIIGQLIQFVVSQFLMGGLYRMAINQVRKGTIDFGDLFSAADVLPTLLGAAILTAIATTVGFLFCIIPGLLIASLLIFTTPLIVDKKMGAIDAMRTSIDVLKPQMWMALAFALVVGLIAIAGAMLCGIGMLITVPLAFLSLAILYRDFFPETVAA